MSDHEARAGIVPIEELLAERDTIVKRCAPLRAKYGPGGVYGDLRKIELSRIAQIIRAQSVKDGVKQTESSIDESAHADPRYVEHVTVATRERAEWAILEERIAAIDFTIQRGQAVARMLSSEAHLSP